MHANQITFEQINNSPGNIHSLNTNSSFDLLFAFQQFAIKTCDLLFTEILSNTTKSIHAIRHIHTRHHPNPVKGHKLRYTNSVFATPIPTHVDSLKPDEESATQTNTTSHSIRASACANTTSRARTLCTWLHFPSPPPIRPPPSTFRGHPVSGSCICGASSLVSQKTTSLALNPRPGLTHIAQSALCVI